MQILLGVVVLDWFTKSVEDWQAAPHTHYYYVFRGIEIQTDFIATKIGYLEKRDERAIFVNDQRMYYVL